MWSLFLGAPCDFVCACTTDANQRQKQLLKEHFEELGSEEGGSEDEEDERGGDASSMDEFSEEDDGRQRVGSCSIQLMTIICASQCNMSVHNYIFSPPYDTISSGKLKATR